MPFITWTASIAFYVGSATSPTITFENVISFGAGLATSGDPLVKQIVKNSTFAFGTYGLLGWSWTAGMRTYLIDCKIYKNGTGFWGWGRSGSWVIYDKGSYIGTDGTTTNVNTYFVGANDGGYSSCDFLFYGSGTTIEDTSLWNIGAYSSLSEIKISTKVAGRLMMYKPLGGKISDQITGGQTAGWANGGSGYCAYMNPSSTTNALELEFYVPVVAATNPTLKFYVKKTSSASNAALSLDVYDSDDDSTKLIDGASVTLTDSWAQYSAASISPTNTGFCRVVLKALDGATTGDIGIDDVSIVISGTTATNALETFNPNSSTLQFDRGGGAPAGGSGGSYTWMS